MIHFQAGRGLNKRQKESWRERRKILCVRVVGQGSGNLLSNQAFTGKTGSHYDLIRYGKNPDMVRDHNAKCWFITFRVINMWKVNEVCVWNVTLRWPSRKKYPFVSILKTNFQIKVASRNRKDIQLNYLGETRVAFHVVCKFHCSPVTNWFMYYIVCLTLTQ